MLICRKKAKEKYDPKLETEAKEWVESVTGEKILGAFVQSLKSGVTLCTLINKIQPNTIKKINKSTMPFMQMENINGFLKGATELGASPSELFQTVDLFEEKNFNQVVLAIHALGRVSRRVKGFAGPYLGPKMSDKHEVHFTEEQLRKGANELNFAQANQQETQKIVSQYLKPGSDSVIKTKETGTRTAELGLLDKPKIDAQKEVSSAKKVGHNIIK